MKPSMTEDSGTTADGSGRRPAPPLPAAVDLASELAEGFALPPFGLPRAVIDGITVPETGERFHPRHAMPRFDDDVLDCISTAYLACGLHSGDPVMLSRVVPDLVARGIAAGAHPSYPDVFHFGQQRVDLADDALEAVILYQFGALAGVLRPFDRRVEAVKCHGALMFDVAADERVCRTMVRAVKTFDPEMIHVIQAGTPGLDWARDAGLRVAAEGFIDRGYGRDGTILPRSHPRALHAEPAAAAAQLLGMVCQRRLVSADDGTQLPFAAETFCLHADTPGAGAMGATVRTALDEAGIEVRPLRTILG